jgi:SAP domain
MARPAFLTAASPLAVPAPKLGVRPVDALPRGAPRHVAVIASSARHQREHVFHAARKELEQRRGDRAPPANNPPQHAQQRYQPVQLPAAAPAVTSRGTTQWPPGHHGPEDTGAPGSLRERTIAEILRNQQLLEEEIARDAADKYNAWRIELNALSTNPTAATPAQPSAERFPESWKSPALAEQEATTFKPLANRLSAYAAHIAEKHSTAAKEPTVLDNAKADPGPVPVSTVATLSSTSSDQKEPQPASYSSSSPSSTLSRPADAEQAVNAGKKDSTPNPGESKRASSTSSASALVMQSVPLPQTPSNASVRAKEAHDKRSSGTSEPAAAENEVPAPSRSPSALNTAQVSGLSSPTSPNDLVVSEKEDDSELSATSVSGPVENVSPAPPQTSSDTSPSTSLSATSSDNALSNTTTEMSQTATNDVAKSNDAPQASELKTGNTLSPESTSRSARKPAAKKGSGFQSSPADIRASILNAIVDGVDIDREALKAPAPKRKSSSGAARAVPSEDLIELIDSGKLKNLTVSKLRRLLSIHELKTTGRKAELIARLVSFVKST